MLGYCKSGNQNPGNFGYFNSRFSMVLEEVAIGLYYSNIAKSIVLHRAEQPVWPRDKYIVIRKAR